MAHVPLLACSTLAFSQQPLTEALHALARAGFTAVELAAFQGWAHVDPSSVARDPTAAVIRDHAAAAGLNIVAVNSRVRRG